MPRCIRVKTSAVPRASSLWLPRTPAAFLNQDFSQPGLFSTRAFLNQNLSNPNLCHPELFSTFMTTIKSIGHWQQNTYNLVKMYTMRKRSDHQSWQPINSYTTKHRVTHSRIYEWCADGTMHEPAHPRLRYRRKVTKPKLLACLRTTKQSQITQLQFYHILHKSAMPIILHFDSS